MATFPHIADESDIQAFDATQQTYEVDVDVVAGERYAFGIATDVSNDGDEVTFSRDDGGGFDSIGAITLDRNNLANLDSSWFEDGVPWESDSTGTVTIKAEVTSGSMDIDGFVAREADSVSGVVEDQGSGTHCYPIAAVYDGATYQVHSEMYSGAIYLSKNSTPQGKVFDGITADRNERYHNGCAIAVLSSGIAVIQVGHNQPYVRVKYLPDGDIANITSQYNAGPNSELTYCQVAVLSNDDILVITRGDDTTSGTDQDALCVRISDADQIDGSGASHTIDVIGLEADAGRWYPRSTYLLDDGSGNEVLGVLYSLRQSADWDNVAAVLFDPSWGSDGCWFSLNGFSSGTSLGTTSTPRFDSTAVTTLTRKGDGILICEPSIGQRYAYNAAWEVTQWPDSAVPTVAKGSVLCVLGETQQQSTSYTPTDARFIVQSEASNYRSGSLISHWELEESSGTRVDSERSNDMADNNTVTQGTGILGNCASFNEANDEYLSALSNNELRREEGSYGVMAWVNLSSKPSHRMGIIAKDDGSPNRDFRLDWDNSLDRFRFIAFDDGGNVLGIAVANTHGAPSLDTWYLVAGWFDAEDQTANISVNAGTKDSVAAVGDNPNSNADVKIGSYTSSGTSWDGRIDEAQFYVDSFDRLPKLLSDAYNGGSGESYPMARRGIHSPPIAQSNSYRLDAAFARVGGTWYIGITDRGTRSPTNRFGESTELYYDWGTAGTIRIYSISDPFSSDISLAEVATEDVQGDEAAAFITGVQGSDNRWIYQSGENELHPTHRQTEHVIFQAVANSGDVFDCPMFYSGVLS